MQSFVWHVLSNPDVHQKLVEELLRSPLSKTVQYKEAQALPYFQACLKEAMRLQPAVGFNITRRVPPGGAQINGTWLPGGTQVAVNAWVMHRDKDIFGNDSEYYDPDRWLNEDKERVKLMERCMFQVSTVLSNNIPWARHSGVVWVDTIIHLIHPSFPRNVKGL